MGMITLDQRGMNASGEKMWHIGTEQEHHGEREKSRSKREEKIVVRRSNRRVRNVVRSRAEQAV